MISFVFFCAFPILDKQDWFIRNIFIIKGNLTKAPILRQSEKGKNYCYLNIAVDNGYGDAKPDFLSVIASGKQAENAVKYLVKGQSVSVCGSVGSFMDKDRNIQIRLRASDVKYGRKPQLSKDKEQPITNDKVETPIEEPVQEPEPIEPPEEFFAEDPDEHEL